MARTNTDNKEIRVYYSKRFAKDFKEATDKNDNFPEAIDDLIDVLKMGDPRRFRVFSMPKLCTGFVVIEDKGLCIKGARGTGGSYRPIHSYYNGHILFVRGFPKNRQEKLTTSEAKNVCRLLQTVKNGTCDDIFKRLSKPLSRSILEDNDEEEYDDCSV